MVLKSFGCSFIFGTDLSDDVSSQMLDWSCDGKYIRPSKLTWPALLAKYHEYEYICYAVPGSGNLQILESILKEVTNASNDLFVIQWTWIDRFDYENMHRTVYDNFWNTILPGDQNQQSIQYYKNLHSEFRDKLTALLYIKNAIDILTQNNIPFIMTNIDDLIFDETWHSNSAIIFLQNAIRPYITKFNGENFLNWAKNNNLQFSRSMHPLEDAHRSAFELINSYNLV